jgi:hypothetical protein
MKKIINFIKSVDTFIEVWSHKIPYLLFDIAVVITANLLTIFGIIMLFFISWWIGFSFICIIYGIATYLIMKRHSKHLDKLIN